MKLCISPQPQPFTLDHEAFERLRGRAKRVASFYHNCLRVFESCLKGELPPIVASMLFSGHPEWMGENFHRYVGPLALKVPDSFRTDESVDGKVLEIQAPGSIWGEYLLLQDYYQPSGANSDEVVSRYCRDLRRALNGELPRLLYLSDGASAQAGVRYFISRIRRFEVVVYGWDPDVSVGNVNYIRGHSFASLVSENLFNARLKDALMGRMMRYDLPVNAIFDSKVLLPLPFWRFTREFFSNEDREMLAFSSFLEPGGAQLPDGSLEPLETFMSRKPRERRFYLKYAGGDLSRNWGSRAVFRLRTGGVKWRQKLASGWTESATGAGAWILQEEGETKDPAFNQAINVKLSSLCAFGHFFGGIAMARDHPHVHGGQTTQMSIIEEGRDQ